MPKIQFSVKVWKSTKAQIKEEIIKAQESSPKLRAEIRRIFQQANRRIQNIESKGLVSPAVESLHLDPNLGYTKFGMSGKKWEDLKAEYAKAVGFLRQPTSTATGTRDYNKHLMDAYDLSEDEFNLMARKLQGKLNSVSDDRFVEQYLMRYKDFTGEMEQEAKDVSDMIEEDAVKLENAISQEVEDAVNEVSDYIDSVENSVVSVLKKFGL